MKNIVAGCRFPCLPDKMIPDFTRRRYENTFELKDYSHLSGSGCCGLTQRLRTPAALQIIEHHLFPLIYIVLYVWLTYIVSRTLQISEDYIACRIIPGWIVQLIKTDLSY